MAKGGGGGGILLQLCVFKSLKNHFVHANSRLSVLVILRQDLATYLSLEREHQKSSLTLSMPRGLFRPVHRRLVSDFVSPATVQGLGTPDAERSALSRGGKEQQIGKLHAIRTTPPSNCKQQVS